MHLSKSLVIDLITIVPMALAQIGIAHLLFCALSRRVSRTWVTLTALALAVTGTFMVIGVLHSYSRYSLYLSSHWNNFGLSPKFLNGLQAATFLWCFSSFGAYVAYRLYSALAPRFAVPFNPDRRRVIQAAGGAAIAAPFAVTAFGAIVQRTDFQVREVDMPIPNLPADLEGLRLLQLSDIHLSPFLSERELARVIDASNELRAHVALVTGDLISGPGDPLDACLRQLSRLRTDAGVFGCMGNHETYARVLDYTAQEGARLGIPFLRSQSRVLRFGSANLNFAGVDYEPFERRAFYLEGAEKLIVPGAVNILLSHNPDVFPVAARQGYDLTLAGHTHGGQITFEILSQTVNVARFFTPFVSGRYQIGKASCYVTRGIGTIGIPIRLGATPEITLIRLRGLKA